MMTSMFTLYLNSIETVGPEGNKLIWVLIIIIFFISITFLLKKSSKINLSWNRSPLLLSLEKNKIYHPTTILLKIENKGKKAVLIQNPVLRFKRGRNTKAYKIKSVNESNIYPLYLEPNKTHSLPVALQPFYDYNIRLKKFSRLRIEFNYNESQIKRSKYVLIKSTLFRKAK